MIDPTARDQRLLRRLDEVATGAGPVLAPADHDRAATLRDGISRALLADAARRAEALAGADLPEDLPPHRDWLWRPDLWSAPSDPCAWSGSKAETPLSADVTLFHDCPLGEIAARQLRSNGPPFALALDVYAFRGSYFSLAIDLPPPALLNLRRRHVLRLDVRLRAERPVTIYARLNLRRGATPATIVRELRGGPRDAPFVDFDLASVRADVSRAEKLWIDLIVDSPAANALSLDEILVSRTPRAEV
jgi:hypothetical protein